MSESESKSEWACVWGWWWAAESSALMDVNGNNEKILNTKKFLACYLDVLDLSRDELMEPLLQAARLHGTRWEQWGRV